MDTENSAQNVVEPNALELLEMNGIWDIKLNAKTDTLDFRKPTEDFEPTSLNKQQLLQLSRILADLASCL